MNYWNQFLWVIFPYLMITVSVVGHIYRYSTDQMSWSARSSEFLEKKNLRWGSMLFHYGIIIVFLGHISGLMLPETFVSKMGINNEIYHKMAVYFGSVGGAITVIGLFLLLIRRYGNKRVSHNSSFADKFIVVLLLLVVCFGIYNTLFYNLSFGDFNYRTSISPWFRRLFLFAPDPKLMADVPITFQIHVILAFLTFGLWPFTRLIHIWSLPVAFIKRSHIIYRRQCGEVK